MHSSQKKFGRAEREIILFDLKEWANLPQNINTELKAVDYKEWAKQLSNKGNRSILNKTGRVSLDSVTRCFGGWEEALSEIGRAPYRINYRTDEELIKYFMSVWAWNSYDKFDQELMPTPSILEAYIKDKKLTKNISRLTYESRWTWGEFKKLMLRYQQGHATIQQVIDGKKNSEKIDKPVSEKTRWKVLERDQSTCQKCFITEEECKAQRITLHVDHIVPRSKGGSSSDLNNLQTLCSRCNLGKGSTDELSTNE